MIRFDSVSKRYGVHEALRDVNLFIPRGQVLGLLGQNGAGKTTAMNILTGCLAPSSGSVSVGGMDVMYRPREAKRLLGYLPENAPIYDEMYTRHYLRFACRLKETEEKAIDGHIAEIAGLTGLTDVLDRKLGNLSRGYRQRVGIAQALCGNPDVLVLDEPTSGLDPRQSSEIRSLIKKLAGDHTVIFSSHILSEVQQLCDRVVILHHGRIICDSDLEALRRGERRLRVTVACGEQSLLPRVQALKSVKRAEVVRDDMPGQTQMILTANGDAPVERELFSLLSAMQTPILRLTPVEESLEEIFLRATQDP